jgi:hypothetical protein
MIALHTTQHKADLFGVRNAVTLKVPKADKQPQDQLQIVAVIISIRKSSTY